MFKYKAILIFSLSLSLNVFSSFNLFSTKDSLKGILLLDGYIQTSKSITDKDWEFIPEVINSFEYSEKSSNEIFITNNKFGINYKESNFILDLERSVHPKKVSLTANSHEVEIFYILNNARAFSLSFKEQKADRQIFECYTLSTLTIGNCSDAKISIFNSKDKYKDLNGSLMLIDGKNNEIQFKIISAVNSILVDEYYIYTGASENKFYWLSPLEELNKGFISSLTFNGKKLGDIVNSQLNILPQKDDFILLKLGLNLSNNININEFTNFFYDVDFVYIDTKNYKEVNKLVNYNLRTNLGFKFDFKKLSLSFYGTIYKNNLFGYEDISFNQRSEHHFKSKYGSINTSIKYKF